jgi:PAS domain-containing protein
MKSAKQSRGNDESGPPARPGGRVAAGSAGRAAAGPVAAEAALLDSLPAAVWEIDAETLAISYANRRAVELFGAEMQAGPDACDWARRALGGDDGERLAAALRQVRADGVTRRVEHGAPAASAPRRRFESQVQVSRRAGELPRALGVMTVPLPDDELNLILQGISDGIVVRDANARLVFANDAAAALCGFASVREMLHAGETSDVVALLQVLDEAGRPIPHEQLPGRVALGGVSVERMICFRGVGDSDVERWTSVRSTPVRGPAGEIRYATSVLRDVTPQKRAAEWQRFLTEATTVLSSSLDLTGTLQRFAEVVACAMADWSSRSG